MLINFKEATQIEVHDLCIVGAGPVGIALARAMATNGYSVLLIESGEESPSSLGSELSRAIIVDANAHAPMEIASCRALGGTSWWWGGRCVPFDEFDFSQQSHPPHLLWPITYEEVRLWHRHAATFLGCGSDNFTKAISTSETLQLADADSIERWAPTVNVGNLYKNELYSSDKISLLLGATVTDLHFNTDANELTAITISSLSKSMKLAVRRCVLACGGLETTRLLLVARKNTPNAFPDTENTLGGFYMGHISGKIADIQLDDPSRVDEFDFFQDIDAFVRRRFTLKQSALKDENILNIAFWMDNPPFYDPAHKSGLLSLIWLALTAPVLGRLLLPDGVRVNHIGPAPRQYARHFRNLFRSPFSMLNSLATILKQRYLTKPRRPGFLLRNRGGWYALHYHAEQLPSSESRVCLSTETDPLGMPRLIIDFKYCEEDAQSVLRAHRALDRALREAQFGRLEYRAPAEDLAKLVLMQASDGYHQLGTTRMGTSPLTSFVDANLRVHSIDNLYVCGGSIFPTSGQANPTFMAVSLAFRLANHLSATWIDPSQTNTSTRLAQASL